MSQADTSYVRKHMLAESPPPAAETGVLKWLRENLFSSPANALLTIVSIYVVYQLIVASAPWLVNSVWVSPSLSACREILDGEVGACFAVLTERWNQLLFGFKYPTALYWRPGLAFILLFVCAAPLLFFKFIPRKFMVLTGLYPFVAYWLIWGGTIFVPLFALLGLLAGAYVYKKTLFASAGLAVIAGFTAALIVWLLTSYMIRDLEYTLALQPVPSRDLGGFMINLMLGVTCISLSIPFGILLALGRQSSMPIIKWICVVFIEFIRGVPLITLLFVANVVLGYFLPPGTSFDLILRVIIMITMFASAYIAEVIRGGLAALPKGQYEAADSLGLDYAQSMQFIILPQAMKISIPGIVNVAVGLFKDTTLVSVISMFDIVGMIRGPILASSQWNGVYWELFGFAAVLFFITCYGISQYSQWLERQLQTDHR